MIHFTLTRLFFILGYTISTSIGEYYSSKSNDRIFRIDYILVSLFSMVIFALLVP